MKKTRKRFLREAQLASALDHPNICTVYEINEDRGLHFIVMQYLEGKRLKQMVRGRALDMESTLSIAVQLADALAAAHERGVIHRDVKATNVIVNERGQAKILDFGLAKATAKNIGDESVMELTQAGVPFGTAGYMSPEQARGGTIDARSDVFSLGIVIYEMAAGRLPFQGKSTVDVMHAIMHEPLPPLSSINPAVPERLQGILEKATAKDVAARYQTMREFQADLKQLLRAVQMQTGQPLTDDSLLPMVAPRHERSNWLTGGVVGRLISRLRGTADRTPISQTNTPPSVLPSRPTGSPQSAEPPPTEKNRRHCRQRSCAPGLDAQFVAYIRQTFDCHSSLPQPERRPPDGLLQFFPCGQRHHRTGRSQVHRRASVKLHGEVPGA